VKRRARDVADHAGRAVGTLARQLDANAAAFGQRVTVERTQCRARRQVGRGDRRARVAGEPHGVGVAVLEDAVVAGAEKARQRVADGDPWRGVEEFGKRRSLLWAGLATRSASGKIVLDYYLSGHTLEHMRTPTPVRAPAAARRRRLRTDERQREIVAAVLALARERGPDSITTQAIAELMGVTQGAVFRHFPDKEAIWLAVFAWVRESLGAALTTAMGRATSPLAKIERAFLAHVAFVAANPGVARVLFHELQYPGDSRVRSEVRATIGAYRKRLMQLFTQARARGEVAPDLHAGLASVLFIGAVQGLVIEASLAGSEARMASRARKTFALLLDGYRGRRER
jgi:AcrR family transcriptional regulator